MKFLSCFPSRQQHARNLFSLLLASVVLSALTTAQTPTRPLELSPLELSRPVRAWEFLPLTGTRAALFGSESGQMEAWVYPLKILRGFHLSFLTEGRVIPAENLARTLTVRPESATILYTGDTFAIRETLFVPIHEPGALILIDVQSAHPLEIEVGFTSDFQLEWPAALGGTYVEWDATQRAFVFGEEQKKYAALVGSPSATDPQLAYQDNYSSSDQNSLRLGLTEHGSETKVVVIAASTQGREDARHTYEHLASASAELLRQSAEYYRNYLAQTVSLDLPDRQLQQAYDWSRLSVIQGLVDSPLLGEGLVAGYRTSGTSQRPGYAWFFGRDSFWTSFALNSVGDFATSRKAIAFISQYQREDGKIPHEISQSASLVDWFKRYPYPYVSADATPLFIIAMNDYVAQSGDVDFARQQWPRLWKAYQFLRSTYDANNFPRNFSVGHGWVEGGPLLPVKTEIYQSGTGLEALRALSNLARLLGKSDESQELSAAFELQKPRFNQVFWSPENKTFAFALDQDDHRVNEPSVLTTVPMWYGITDADKSNAMITQLAQAEHQTDWGMRILSSRSAKYGGGGYHYGSVWPLFTGWAAVGEYRYHRAHPAFSNLRANALLALDGSLGHVTEVLSGDYYTSLSTSSPHQIWSAAMVVSPILRGMLGLQADAQAKRLIFAPHVPADWTAFSVGKVRVAGAVVDLRYLKNLDGITLQARQSGAGDCSVEFSPAVSLRAQVARVEWNGRPLPFHVEKNLNDQHVTVLFPVGSGLNTLHIQLKNEFGLVYTNQLPALGVASHGLRILGESWNNARSQLTVEVQGVSGERYELGVWNPAQIASLEGAELVRTSTEQGVLHLAFPSAAAASYTKMQVVLHFKSKP